MKGSMKAPKSVDEYLLYLPDAERTALEKLRKAIKVAAPQAEEYIWYGMPGYKYKGSLVYFAAFKKHCSFFVWRKVAADFAQELQDFKVVGSTIHFTPQKPLPAALVKKIVKLRVEENEERSAAKKLKKK